MKKKGQLEIGASWLLPYMLITFFVIILIFFVLFALKNEGVTDKIDSINFEEVGASNNLINLLKTEVEVEGDTIWMSEFILIWYYNQNKYNVLLDSKLKEILNLMESKSDYQLVIQEMKQISGGNPQKGKRKYAYGETVDATKFGKINEWRTSIDLFTFDDDIELNVELIRIDPK